MCGGNLKLTLLPVEAPKRWEESRDKLPGHCDPEGGPGLECFVYVIFLGSIIIYRLYKLTLPDQAQFSLLLRVSLSDLVQIFLAIPPLL
jgi:hypothetical protein